MSQWDTSLVDTILNIKEMSNQNVTKEDKLWGSSEAIAFDALCWERKYVHRQTLTCYVALREDLHMERICYLKSNRNDSLGAAWCGAKRGNMQYAHFNSSNVTLIKGTLQPKINILSSFTPNLYDFLQWSTKGTCFVHAYIKKSLINGVTVCLKPVVAKC